MTTTETKPVTRCRHCKALIRPSGSGWIDPRTMSALWVDEQGWENCDGTDDSHEPATVCRVVDQAVQWTDSNGRLNIGGGDLVLRDYRWSLVDHVSFNPNRQMRVRVEFAGSFVAETIEPSDWVTVRRYITEEAS